MLARIKIRQFVVNVRQRGLLRTLFWTAYGYLRLNRFIAFVDDLSPGGPPATTPEGVGLEIWPAGAVRAWRAGRRRLPPEFFQDEIDGVRVCAVALVGGEVAGLIWIYGPGDHSRMFRLHAAEVELNHGCVRPEYRGRRLFTAVLRFAGRWLAGQGCTTAHAAVHADNQPSLRAFSDAGFVDIASVRHFLFFRPKIQVPRIPGGIAFAEG